MLLKKKQPNKYYLLKMWYICYYDLLKPINKIIFQYLLCFKFKNKCFNYNQKKPPRNWNVQTIERILLFFSNINYGMDSHISVKDKIKHKIYDLRLNNKISNRLCPVGVFSWENSSNIMFFKICHTNCLRCNTCLVKPTEKTIDWNICRNGDGPNFITENCK